MTTNGNWHKTFRRNVKALAEAQGGVEELSSLTGIKFWTLRDWMRRDCNPGVDLVIKFARAVGYSVDEILTEKID